MKWKKMGWREGGRVDVHGRVEIFYQRIDSLNTQQDYGKKKKEKNEKIII